MPKIGDVTALIQSIGWKDYDRARMQVAAIIANERGNNRETSAKQLERALKTWGADNAKFLELSDKVKPLVCDTPATKTLNELYLSAPVKEEVYTFLWELEKAQKLREEGLQVRNRVLLAGPPGNGKTSLAGAIGNEMGIPCYTFKLSNILDSYMGNSSKNISAIFEQTFANRCVLFIDELDALGVSRSDGETGSKREYNVIVNTLIMALDRLPDTTIIIGATNFADSIDPALVRRFNLKLWLDIPSRDDIHGYIHDYEMQHMVDLQSCDACESALVGQSWSRVEEFCIARHRAIVLGTVLPSTSPCAWVGRTNQPEEVE